MAFEELHRELCDEYALLETHTTQSKLLSGSYPWRDRARLKAMHFPRLLLCQELPFCCLTFSSAPLALETRSTLLLPLENRSTQELISTPVEKFPHSFLVSRLASLASLVLLCADPIAKHHTNVASRTSLRANRWRPALPARCTIPGSSVESRLDSDLTRGVLGRKYV